MKKSNVLTVKQALVQSVGDNYDQKVIGDDPHESEIETGQASQDGIGWREGVQDAEK